MLDLLERKDVDILCTKEGAAVLADIARKELLRRKVEPMSEIQKAALRAARAMSDSELATVTADATWLSAEIELRKREKLESGACCAYERRSFSGGCLNCGDPCI